LTKTDLISLVAEKSGLTKKGAARAVDAFCEAVKEAAAKGEKVILPGFGAFAVVTAKERKGRDLRTGEEIVIPAKKAVRFRPGKLLKEAVK